MNKISIILGILLAIAIGVAGYFYLQTQQNPGTILGPYTPSASENPTPVPSAVEDEDWKFYEDSKLGISINYPSKAPFTLEKKSGPIYFYGETPVQVEGFMVYAKGVGEGDGFQIYKTSDESVLQTLDADKPVTTKNINGLIFQQYQRVGMGKSYGYVITKNGAIYIFQSTLGPTNSTFEKMMETLKFTL